MENEEKNKTRNRENEGSNFLKPVIEKRIRTLSLASLSSSTSALGFPEEPQLSENFGGEDQSIKDKGYAWIIAVILLVINSIMNGYTFGFGLIYAGLLDYLPNETPASLSFIMGAFVGSRGLFSPVGVAFGNAVGYRTALMTGAATIFLGIYSASYLSSPILLTLTLGCMAGCGQTVIDMQGVDITRNYFDKRIGTATALRLAGLTLGGFIFPPIYAFLIETFGFSYALVIISCIMAQNCVLGAIVRPIQVHKKIVMKDRCSKRNEKYDPSLFETEQPPSKKKKPVDYCLFKKIDFVLLMFTHISRAAALPAVFFYLPLLLKSAGLTSYHSSILLSYMSASDVVIRLTLGPILEGLVREGEIDCIGVHLSCHCHEHSALDY